jgi:AcrR family transcriptional regulator
VTTKKFRINKALMQKAEMPEPRANEKPRQRATQDRAIQTRHLILNVAGKAIADEGIHKVRYSAIAKKAKIPQALMGYHFPNIETLLTDLIYRELEKLKVASVEIVEKHSVHPKKALAEYVRAPFKMGAADPVFRAVWSGFYHLAVVNPEYANMCMAIRKAGRERILSIITMVLATEGMLSVEKKYQPEDLIVQAASIQGLMTGLAVIAASEPHRPFKEMGDIAVAGALRVLGLGED